MSSPGLPDEVRARRRQAGHPTIRDVAARAGVSKSVVSRVMTDSPLVSPERRRAVLEAAAELGYRPNAAARHLVQRRTFIVGAVVDDLHNPFFADMLDGVDKVARDRGFKIVVMTGHRDKRQEEEAVEALLELRVDGLLLSGPQVPPRALARAAVSTPVVVVGHRLRTPDVHTVTTDDRRGAELAVEHLVALGHRRIAHIAADRTPPARDRVQGYRRAMARAGLEPSVVPGDFGEAGGHAGASSLLAGDAPPTAICAPNDVAAIGAIDAVEDSGLSVPRDVSIVGYDDTALAGLRHISLTTVHQPRHALGERAMEVVLRQLDGLDTARQRVLLPPKLVVRATTAAPPRG
jgi:DNA-binding LacI/PurR family transcriptional regulator